MDDIDTLRTEALRLLASANSASESFETVKLRRRAARMIELADRIEQRGCMIMTEQPTLRAVLSVVR